MCVGVCSGLVCMKLLSCLMVWSSVVGVNRLCVMVWWCRVVRLSWGGIGGWVLLFVGVYVGVGVFE